MSDEWWPPADGSDPDEEAGMDDEVMGDPELADVVARLRRAMRRAWRVEDVGNPLSVAQLELLTSLSDHPGARPGQLAQALRLAPNSVTTLVNGLLTRGLVTRADGIGDRRTVHLTLTAAGEAAVHGWQATNAGILRDALRELPGASRQALADLLPVLRDLVEAIDRATERTPDER